MRCISTMWMEEINDTFFNCGNEQQPRKTQTHRLCRNMFVFDPVHLPVRRNKSPMMEMEMCAWKKLRL